jgi:hypothetical protein
VKKRAARTATRRREHSPAVAWWLDLPRVAQVFISIATVVSIIFGAIAWGNAELVFAKDLRRLEHSIMLNAQQNEKAILELRKSSIADKVYELEARPRRSPHEQATLLRYRSEMESIDRTIRDRQRMLDAMRVPK